VLAGCWVKGCLGVWWLGGEFLLAGFGEDVPYIAHMSYPASHNIP